MYDKRILELIDQMETQILALQATYKQMEQILDPDSAWEADREFRVKHAD